MEQTAKLRVKRTLVALMLGLAFLTVVPALLSLIVIPSAWSDRSDVPSSRGGGVTVIEKNGHTPGWMAELLQRTPSAEAGMAVELDPNKGLSI